MIDDLWYKNGVIYCLSVGTYMDANGDGVGDFKGLLRRLDYLHGLGITATSSICSRKTTATPTSAASIVWCWSRMGIAGIGLAGWIIC
jgi:hypothetical protein